MRVTEYIGFSFATKIITFIIFLGIVAAVGIDRLSSTSFLFIGIAFGVVAFVIESFLFPRGLN